MIKTDNKIGVIGRSLILLFTLTLIFSSSVLYAQSKRDTNSNFIIHKVSEGESIFSISKRYYISTQDIYMFNPKAKKRLRVGSKLKISKVKYEEGKTIADKEARVKEIEDRVAEEKRLEQEKYKAESIKREQDIEAEMAALKYFKYRVVPGDTYWSLKQRYGVDQSRLELINPILKEGLNVGFEIDIPTKIEESAVKVVPVNESKFDRRVVRRGETLYSIAIEYSMNVRDIRALNPVLDSRELMVGETILVKKKVLNSDNNYTSESLSSGANEEFSGSDSENYDVKAVIEQREKDRAVDSSDFKVIAPEEDMLPIVPCDDLMLERKDSYSVCLFLPLYYDEFREATLSNLREDIEEAVDTLENRAVNSNKVLAKSRNFLDYYEGTLLALESLQSRGAKIELTVYDTNRDRAKIESIVSSSSFKEFDLVVGPVYESLQESVVRAAEQSGVAFVSPLAPSSKLIENSSNYYLVNPTKDYVLDRSVDYAVDEFFDDNFVVINGGNNSNNKFSKRIKERLFTTGYYGEVSEVLFKEYNFEKDGLYGLRYVLHKDRDNVIFISSSEESDVNKLIGALSGLANEFPITLLGVSDWTRYKSLKLESLHLLNTKYLSYYSVDYNNSNVKSFVKRYRDEFSTEPTQFSFQGYDVMLYFGQGLYNYGVKFENCLSNVRVKPLQLGLTFSKYSEHGGYMNRTLYINSYNRDYTITHELYKARVR